VIVSPARRTLHGRLHIVSLNGLMIATTSFTPSSGSVGAPESVMSRRAAPRVIVRSACAVVDRLRQQVVALRFVTSEREEP
jgi:hypothetical protein